MDNPNYNYYEDKRSNSMALAALILGIIAIATGCCLYTGIICGALAIIFALLSRGGEMTLAPKAKIALILGIIGIALTILMFVSALLIVIAQFGSFENYMQYYYDMLGIQPSVYPNTL